MREPENFKAPPEPKEYSTKQESIGGCGLWATSASSMREGMHEAHICVCMDVVLKCLGMVARAFWRINDGASHDRQRILPLDPFLEVPHLQMEPKKQAAPPPEAERPKDGRYHCQRISYPGLVSFIYPMYKGDSLTYIDLLAARMDGKFCLGLYLAIHA